MEKIKSGIKNLTCTQKALSEALGLSTMRIAQLIEEEVAIRDEADKNGGLMLFDSIRNYYSSKQSSSGGVNFWQEKGLHERAKRQLAELKYQQAEGELYVAADVESALLELVTVLRNNLLGLPNKVAVALEGQNREVIYSRLTEEIEEMLSEISEYKYENKKRTAKAVT